MARDRAAVDLDATTTETNNSEQRRTGDSMSVMRKIIRSDRSINYRWKWLSNQRLGRWHNTKYR